MRKKRELLTPVVGGSFDLAGSKGLTFRKQVLPLSEINYKGKRINFDRSYHSDLINAFKDRAIDSTPFVLANDDNEHTMDPERVRGHVVDLGPEQPGETPGLWATIKFASKKAARAVLGNQELGVSCRIQEDRERADGKNYRRSIIHVLGTLDPRVTGMEPWKAVSLSGYDSDRNVLDLTREDYAMPKTAKKGKKSAETGEVDLSELVEQISAMDKDELTEFIQGAFTDLAEDDADDEDEADDDVEETDEEDEDDEEEDDTELSETARRQIDLAQASATEAGQRAEEALTLLSDERWNTEAEALLQAGIPKAIVDLAEDLLHSPTKRTIDLSNGNRLDVAKRVRKILSEFTGFIELSRTRGHFGEASDAPGQGQLSAADKRVLDGIEEQYGT